MKEGRLHFIESRDGDQSGERKSGSIVIDRDVGIDYGNLEAYCWRQLEDREIDLLTVVSAVAHADRATRRNQDWCRIIRLSVPVLDLDIWTHFRHDFEYLLKDLTGDNWILDLVRRKNRPEQVSQLKLRDPVIGEPVIIPFSGGLDSYLALHAATALPGRDSGAPLLVSAKNNSSLLQLLDRTTASTSPLSKPLAFPVKLNSGRNAEPSFRTRPLIFLSAAVLAWRTSSAKKIVVPENGQGSLGPSLVRSGWEYPYRSSHPGFTRLFSRVVGRLWDEEPPIEHPNLWKTKAQVIDECGAIRSPLEWSKTRSCANSLRKKGRVTLGLENLPKHCGICGGCILRRVALFNSHLREESQSEGYLWHDLNAVSLERALSHRNRAISTTSNDYNIARSNLLTHYDLADLGGDSSAFERSAKREIHEIARVTGRSYGATEKRLGGLMNSHREEWWRFVSNVSESSWIRQLAGGRNAND